MTITKRTPRDSYNHTARTLVGLDDSDYSGTTRNATRVDWNDLPGVTRGIVRTDRPRTWKQRTQN